MNRVLALISILLLGLAAGCSEDIQGNDNDEETPPATVETIDNGDGTFTTTVDAGYLDATDWVGFSFATGEEAERAEGDVWDLSFKFANIIQNGGANGTAGVCLVAFDDDGFDDLDAAPAAVYFSDSGEDDPGQAFNFGEGWYDYDFVTHSMTIHPDRYYVVRTSAGGFVKLQIDSFVDGAGTPGFPSFTWAAIDGEFDVFTSRAYPDGGFHTVVDAGTMGGPDFVYLDLGTGLQVAPANPADDASWDLTFNFSTIQVNGGVNGTGNVEVAAFDDGAYDALSQAPAGGYATDATDDDVFKSGDGWYTYDFMTHDFTVHADRYYAIRDAAGDFWKLRMTGFVDDAGTPGFPSFDWEAITAP